MNFDAPQHLGGEKRKSVGSKRIMPWNDKPQFPASADVFSGKAKKALEGSSIEVDSEYGREVKAVEKSEAMKAAIDAAIDAAAQDVARWEAKMTQPAEAKRIVPWERPQQTDPGTDKAEAEDRKDAMMMLKGMFMREPDPNKIAEMLAAEMRNLQKNADAYRADGNETLAAGFEKDKMTRSRALEKLQDLIDDASKNRL
jgi:hypothetical protein